MQRHHRKQNDCLNCGATVEDKFCSKCGQENIETHENFFHMAYEFVADYFHFDNKFVGSMVPLFLKPGFLTKEYTSGRRKRYISPLRMFFFITILFVLVNSFVYKKLESRIERNIFITEDSAKLKADSLIKTAIQNKKLSKKDSIKINEAKGYINVSVGDKKVKKKLTKESIMHAVEAAFVTEAKYLMFFLLPVYALLLKLLYLRRNKYYVDHLIFVMHLMSFTFLLFILGLGIPMVFNLELNAFNTIIWSIIFITVAYSFFALKYIYGQSILKTFIKALLFNLFSLIVTTMVFFAYTAFNMLS